MADGKIGGGQNRDAVRDAAAPAIYDRSNDAIYDRSNDAIYDRAEDARDAISDRKIVNTNMAKP